MEQWKVLKRDCLPAYITWDRYLANQESLASAPIGSGLQGEPPRRLRAAHRPRSSAATAAVASRRPIGPRAEAYYSCVRHLHEGTEQTCFGLKAAAVDDLVAQQVLRALEPAALELSCRAMEDVQRDRARLDKHWKQRLERARYEAEDAERRYRAVDPENRLVARSLEQRWEETLRAERQVRDDYDRFLREQPPQLSQEERARIAALSSDLPALWHAPGTTYQDRKEIVRHLVEKVVVHVKNDSEYVDVTIHWQGGFTSQHEVVRPVQSYEQLRDFDKLMDRIAALRHEGHTAAQIADCLNREGFARRSGAARSSRARPPIAEAPRPGEREDVRRPTRAARVVVAEAGRGDPRVRRQARRLGAPGMGPLPQDARATPVGPLGRQAGGEATPQAGGPVSPWRRFLSNRSHDTEGPDSLRPLDATPQDDDTAMDGHGGCRGDAHGSRHRGREVEGATHLVRFRSPGLSRTRSTTRRAGPPWKNVSRGRGASWKRSSPWMGRMAQVAAIEAHLARASSLIDEEINRPWGMHDTDYERAPEIAAAKESLVEWRSRLNNLIRTR